MSLFDLLKEKGFINSITGQESDIRELLDNKKTTFYLGIDPTAESLHLGHLFSLVFSLYLVREGHKCIYIMGGGTVKLGDPSGKNEGRKALDYSVIERNKVLVEKQIRGILSNLSALGMNINQENLMFIDNNDWIEGLNYIDFLRDVGSSFTVNDMIKSMAYRDRLFEIYKSDIHVNSKDKIKNEADKEQLSKFNMSDKDVSIKFIDDGSSLNFVEFNYQLLQAYDFLVLFERYNCEIQIGGADQWTNILRGTELIKSKTGKKAFGLLFNLIVDKDGKKMGKTEGGALFLSPSIVSPYNFYQYFINIPDEHTPIYLRNFTFLSQDEIDKTMSLNPVEQKKVLAYNLTLFVHGKEEADKAVSQSKAAFSGDFSNLDAFPKKTVTLSELVAKIKKDSNEAQDNVDPQNINLKNVITYLELCSSNSELKKIVQAGGVSVFGKKITLDDTLKSYREFLQDGKIAFSIGKKRLVAEFIGN